MFDEARIEMAQAGTNRHNLSMEALAESLDDLPQIVRVFLDDPARLLQPRRFGLRPFLFRARLFWWFDVRTVREDKTGRLI
jgi:hypothetical protein